MRWFVLTAVSAAALSLACASAAEPGHPAVGAWGVDLSARGVGASPGDDFFTYVNGTWDKNTEIPADQTSAGGLTDLFNAAQADLRTIIETSQRSPADAQMRQIGAFYTSFMDEARIEQLDATPLKADLERVQAVRDKAEFAALMAHAHGGLGASIVGFGVYPDAKHPEAEALYMNQGGLGLSDRDYYLADSFKAKREAYQAYIERALGMVGYPDPASAAKAVYAFEESIARVSWPSAERRDVEKLYNPMNLGELQVYAPGLDWRAYFAAAGIGDPARVVVEENTAIRAIADIYAHTPLETLKAWQTFRIVDDASPYLSKRFAQSQFDFRGRTLAGVQTLRPRWRRGVSLVDDSLGDALGEEYVKTHFTPAAKQAMEALVGNLKLAMSRRIEQSAWMADSTKRQALEKLARMRVMVGYPDKWREYSALELSPDDLYGNVSRSQAFEWRYQVGKIGKPVDVGEWSLTPQTVNAYNGGLENKIVFPAAILQPPFFDVNADAAVNYGAIGAVIGHEITHGFDDQGRKMDATGGLRDWWTAQDAARFEAEAARLGAQYDAFEPVPGAHVNGKLTMGENIADLGGLLVALDAYHASLGGKPAPVIDGYTGDQRFFLAYAQAWREKRRPDAIRQQLASNPHTPSRFRAIGTPRNMDAWYEAFQVKEGDKYWVAPKDRVRIW